MKWTPACVTRNMSSPVLMPSFLLSALTLPLRSGESRGRALPQCWSGLVSGGAQEPGLLRLRQAPHPYHHQQNPACLVSSALEPGKWREKRFACVEMLTCVFAGTLVVGLQPLQLLETNKLTSRSCSVYWTRRWIWRRSQGNCNNSFSHNLPNPHPQFTIVTYQSCQQVWCWEEKWLIGSILLPWRACVDNDGH